MSTPDDRSRVAEANAPSAPDARTLTLSEAMHLALACGVACTVASVESTVPTRVGVRLYVASQPEQVVVQLGDGAAVGSQAAREVDDGMFECERAAPQQRIEFMLLLGGAEHEVAVPMVAGDRAAVATYGWADTSIGARCEVRVSRAALDRALWTLTGEHEASGSDHA